MAAKLTDHDVWYSIEDVDEEAILVVTSAGCGACRRLERLLEELDEDGELEGLPVLWVEAERAGGLIEELEVFHLPALVAVRRGELAEPVHCALQREALREALAALRGAAREPAVG